MLESYSKRLNILVHDLKQQETDETKNKPKHYLTIFLSEALEITLNSINIVDLHHLPQHAICKAGTAITRPIIVKLLTKFDKEKIFKSLVNL